MLSFATTPISFVGPATGFASTRATHSIFMSEDVPPVFSKVEEQVPLPAPPEFNPSTFAQSLPGISAPLGFFDPAGFCDGTNKEGAASEGKIRFYREVEVKHGRIAMLAALGFPLAEQFHPLFGGNIDV
eukprot:scaffold20851_cov21-Tisochrysis_lutea.AAC.2